MAKKLPTNNTAMSTCPKTTIHWRRRCQLSALKHRLFAPAFRCEFADLECMRPKNSLAEHPRVLKMLPGRVCDFSLLRSVHQYQQAAPEVQTPRFHTSSSSVPSSSFSFSFSFSFSCSFYTWILPVHVSPCPRLSMLLFLAV